MTSRFREELAAPAGRRPGPRRRGRPADRRDRRSGGLLQRPDRAARAARPGPLRVHDPALGRDRRRDRRRRSRWPRADPAAGAARRPRLTPRPVRRPARSAVPSETDGPWARLARRVMRHPVAVLVPTLALLLLLGSPFLHVRFNAPDSSDPAADVPSRAAFDLLQREFGEGEFAPLTLADPDRRPGHDAGQPGRAVRLLAPARGRPARQPRRQPRRRRPAARRSPSTSCSTATRTGRATGSSRRRWRPRPAAT